MMFEDFLLFHHLYTPLFPWAGYIYGGQERKFCVVRSTEGSKKPRGICSRGVTVVGALGRTPLISNYSIARTQRLVKWGLRSKRLSFPVERCVGNSRDTDAPARFQNAIAFCSPKRAICCTFCLVRLRNVPPARLLRSE